jgi:hypothetical protein
VVKILELHWTLNVAWEAGTDALFNRRISVRITRQPCFFVSPFMK